MSNIWVSLISQISTIAIVIPVILFIRQIWKEWKKDRAEKIEREKHNELKLKEIETTLKIYKTFTEKLLDKYIEKCYETEP